MSSLRCLYIFFVWIHAFGGYAICSSYPNNLMNKSSEDDTSHADLSICVQEAKCKPMENSTCFGITLPYTHTSLDLVEDSLALLEVLDNIGFWQELRSIPYCWAVVQPLLCAVYMPKCENGTLSLPSQEMCNITKRPCRVVQEKHGWPSFLRCENEKLFPPGCQNPLQELQYNTSSKCIPPLVETDNASSWNESVEGCGLQCRNPLFTEEEHEKIWSFIRFMAPLCFIANLFAVLTFVISWKTSNQYPAIIIFYMNVCLLLTCLGFLIQFFPGAREDITCRSDSTIRQMLPRSSKNLCYLTFLLTYPSLMVALVLFTILAYAWYMMFIESGASTDSVKKKVFRFNYFAFIIPMVLTTIVITTEEVNGDPLSGICFVNYTNPIMRMWFLAVPVAAAAFIGGFFVIVGLYKIYEVTVELEKLKKKEEETADKQKMIHEVFIMFRLGVIVYPSFLFMILFLTVYVKDYIMCQATFSTSTSSAVADMKCKQNSPSSIDMVRLNLTAFFWFSIAVSSWTWTCNSINSWKQFIFKNCFKHGAQKKLTRKETDEYTCLETP